MNALLSTDELAVTGNGAGLARATVASLCAESGWPCQARAGDCLVKLELHRQGTPFYARVGRAADGGIRAWVDLTATACELGGGLEQATATQPPACRNAVEAILAEVSDRIRLVRGCIKEAPIGWAAGFEVCIPAEGGGQELADGLSALSVACDLAGPEIQLLLSDPDIVELYLVQTCRARGRSPGRQDTPDTRVPGEPRS